MTPRCSRRGPAARAADCRRQGARGGQNVCWSGRVRADGCGTKIRGDLVGPITHCHCWRYRKHSGSSFGTTSAVKATDLAFLAGEDLLKSWESSAGVHRFFAGCCGSPIFKRDDAAAEILGFRLGTLDSDPGRKADLHFMVGSKVPWLDIQDPFRERRGLVPSSASVTDGL